MDKIMKYVYFTVFTFLIAIVIDTTGVQAVPQSGGIQCDYNLSYFGFDLKEYKMKVTYKIKDGNILKNGEWTCDEKDVNSPCVRRGIENGVFYQNTLTNPVNFYNSVTKEWQCPAISYSIYNSNQIWGVNIGRKADKFGDLNPDDTQTGKSNSLSGETSSKVNPDKEVSKPSTSTTNCFYKTSTGIQYDLKINKETFIAEVVINGQKSDYSLNVKSSICPSAANLTYCKSIYSSTGDYSKDIIKYDGICDVGAYENLKTEKRENQTTDAAGNEIDLSKPDEDLNDTEFGEEVDADCQEILGSTLDIIQTIFNWIKYIAPVLLVVFGTIDYAKVVITDDKEGIKKATSNFIKRAIAAAAIFFLPLIINVILSLPEIETGLNDVVCGISKVVIK